MANPRARFVGHATVELQLGGLTVLTDPVLGRTCTGLRRVVAPVDVPRADVVVISHLHADHLDLASLRRLHAPTVVVPRGAGQWLRRKGIEGVREVGRGESTSVGELTITGVECDHDDRRWPHIGPHATPLGYLLADGAQTVWFAGDTDLFDGMSDLGDLDLALVPVWGWGPDLGPGHLDPLRAAEAVRIAAPRMVVPIHWGTLAPVAYARFMRPQLWAPPRDFASAARDLAPHVRVLLTEPGHPVVG